MKLISTNPSRNYEVIGEVEVTSKEHIVAMVSNAHKAQEDWAKVKLSQRTEILKDLLNRFNNEREKLARISSQEMGMVKQ